MQKTKQYGRFATQADTPARQIAAGKKQWVSGPRSQEWKKTKKNFEAYSSLEPDEISWENFRAKWLPGLKKDGYLVGLNWSGPNVVGYDCEPDWVLKAIKLQMQAQSNA